jgi:hypothetical protein
MPTCSALTTSIITPPFNMRARPVLTVKLDSASPFVVVVPLEGSSVAILPRWWVNDLHGGSSQGRESGKENTKVLRVDHRKNRRKREELVEGGIGRVE